MVMVEKEPPLFVCTETVAVPRWAMVARALPIETKTRSSAAKNLSAWRIR